jgi:hypothetical protein
VIHWFAEQKVVGNEGVEADPLNVNALIHVVPSCDLTAISFGETARLMPKLTGAYV